MVGGTTTRSWALVVVSVAGMLAMAGCHLGVPAVTYPLSDPDDYGMPLGSTGMDIGDVDGDEDLDVVATGTRGYAVLTNDGSGGLSPEFRPTYEPTTIAPELADIDRDGDLDIVGVEARYPDPTIAVRHNDGGGTFGLPEAVSVPPAPNQLVDIAVGDADGDDDDDIFAVYRNQMQRLAGVHLNDGAGAFSAPIMSPLQFSSEYARTVRIAIGDLDGDGADDLVATDTGSFTTPWGEVVDGTVAMIGISDGTGSLLVAGPPMELTWEGEFGALVPALADLDGDDDLDVAVGGPGSITTALGDGAGGFADPQMTTVAEVGMFDFVVATDVDDDGIPDLVGFDEIRVTTAGAVVYGDGQGGVADVHEFGTGATLGGDGTFARQTGAGDLDGDGDADLLFLGADLGVVENATTGRPSH